MNSSIRLDKRDLILAKGAEVMTRRGYHGAGVQEIVQAAGVPKGSFYHYFASKEDFALQALQQVYQPRLARYAEALANPALSPRERILAYAQRIPGFRYTEVVSEPTPEWSGKRGYLTEHFEASELRDAAADMYVCGPPPMVESIKSWLIAQNLQNVQLYYEKFTESNV